MEFQKIFADELDHGYAVMRLHEQGRDFVLIASEENKPCYAYDLDNHYRRITVWNDVGGTMTMVQIPGTLDFLATQRFYPGFNSAACRIVRAHFNGVDWDLSEVAQMPYIHRFDIIEHDGGFRFIGCSIANSKQDTDDWSDPGKVFVGMYDEQKNILQDVHPLDVRITKNHGYRRGDGTYSFITGAEGIFKLLYPADGVGWRIERVADNETSDMAGVDVDGDGRKEYLAIQGFHGCHLRLYDDHFNTIAVSNRQTPFGHAIDGVTVSGETFFLFGYRDGKQELELVTLDDGTLKETVIDSGVGPSNVLVYRKAGKDYLLSANREKNEVAIYRISGTAPGNMDAE
ncbi:MAG: hypothetical protein LKF41_03195 [Bifidobacterium sp.]|jgi:hypothetical protein|nr:hypothetical protein [Bifidobacterium sp.]MCH4174849.1 hypothetical protein [Bifidobacterium sp.]